MELDRADFLVPGPLVGSGGHRTIYRNAKALAEAGCEVAVHIESDERRGRRSLRKVNKFYDAGGLSMHATWPDEVDGDVLVGTTWQSACHAARIRSNVIKAHFVQDYEGWFYPQGDQRLAAERVHDLGLESVVIGNWLSNILEDDHGLSVRSVPFTADLSTYGRQSGPGGANPGFPQVVAMYQPEKPRRCPDLMEAALARLLGTVKNVKVITVGSRFGPRLGERHEHLGLVSTKRLSELYRSSSLGLSMSTSNPSRVPFEMMAAGLPVVELAIESNIYDLPESGCLLSRPDPASLALAMTRVISEPDLAASLSEGGIAFMANRDEAKETDAFVKAINSIVKREAPTAVDRSPLFTGEFVQSPGDTLWYPRGESSLLGRIRRKASRGLG